MTEPQEEKKEDQQEEVQIDYKDKWLRAHADYQNLQKEVTTQRAEWAKMSEAQILEEFIPIYENFKKAFAHEVSAEDASVKNWKQGIEYIMKQFGDVLRSHGVEEIETTGKPFDPMLHEALIEEDADCEEGIIIRELQGGYKIGSKILLPAKVVVCKKLNF